MFSNTDVTCMCEFKFKYCYYPCFWSFIVYRNGNILHRIAIFNMLHPLAPVFIYIDNKLIHIWMVSITTIMYLVFPHYNINRPSDFLSTYQVSLYNALCLLEIKWITQILSTKYSIISATELNKRYSCNIFGLQLFIFCKFLWIFKCSI